MPKHRKNFASDRKSGRVRVRALNGEASRRKTMRRRHQKGQLIQTETGYAVRFYESGEGHRRRVQTWLGDFKQLPNATAAKNAMDAVLFTVNQNPTANPQPNTTTFRVFAQRWLTES
jgi:hypothetical protein